MPPMQYSRVRRKGRERDTPAYNNNRALVKHAPAHGNASSGLVMNVKDVYAWAAGVRRGDGDSPG